jgi:hypothetical protein
MARARKAVRRRLGKVSYYEHHGAWHVYYRDGAKQVRRRAGATESEAAQVAAQVHAQLSISAPTLFSFTPVSALLPTRTRAALIGLHGKLDDLGFERPAVKVNLFKPSTGPEHGLNAVALKAQGLGLTAIGKTLGITKRKANLATQYGEAMLAAGITDPFRELTGPPEKASRWGIRRGVVHSRDGCR